MSGLLAFDTATERLSIGVAAHGRVLTHESIGGAQASAHLIPSILALLAQAGVALRDLDAIAFGRGPGAFTGLRTACSVAQGLAYGAGKPVLGLDTLLAVAEDARAGRASARIWVAMDARIDEIYAAQYAFEAGTWSVLDMPMLATAAVLNERWRAAPPAFVAGNAITAFGGRLETGTAELAPEAGPRAAALIELARAQWARGEAVAAAHALPLYLRDKVALTTVERDAVRESKRIAQELSR